LLQFCVKSYKLKSEQYVGWTVYAAIYCAVTALKIGH